MPAMGKARSALTMSGRVVNEAVSFLAFCVLDLVDFLLCFVFKAADLWIEADFRPCYCSSTKEAITSSGKILVSEQGGESKVVSLNSSKLQLEDISDTLYSRPSLVSEVSRQTLSELKRFKLEDPVLQSKRRCSTFTVNTTIVEMLQGKFGRHQSHQTPRWSDCDCKQCTSWISSSSPPNNNTTNTNAKAKTTLFVKSQCPTTGNTFCHQIITKILFLAFVMYEKITGYCDDAGEAVEDVLFIHGFISSSLFWTETVFPNFSSAANSTYRFFAVDLLGFGRSPKPSESMYTLREHLEMIERSVLEAHKVKSFHIVAHSLGCILALALAVKHPQSVKSLTLLAPVITN